MWKDNHFYCSLRLCLKYTFRLFPSSRSLCLSISPFFDCMCIWQNYWFLRATLLLIGILAQFPIEIIHEIFKIYYQHYDCVCMCLSVSKQVSSYRRSLISNAHSSSTLSLIKKTPTTHVCHTSRPYPNHIKAHLLKEYVLSTLLLATTITEQSKENVTFRKCEHTFSVRKFQNPLSISIVHMVLKTTNRSKYLLFCHAQTICNARKTIFKSTLKLSIPKVHFCLRL